MANEFVIKNGYLSKADSQITGSLFVSGAVSASITPNTVGFYGTASWAQSASWAPGATPTTPGGLNTQIQFNSASIFSGSSNLTFDYVNNKLILTGSLNTTGSNTLIGDTYLTGSLNITGSTTQIGDNNLFGDTTLSGSIIISGAFGTNDPTVRIYGDTEHNGYIRFDPVSTNIDTSISASYIYVSGSTNDLYFSQNGSGYNNVTRLRWLEGNLYTGLLHGGLISSASSTTFNISSGSGIIVNLNASLTDDPYPTIQFIQWGNLINQTLTYRTTNIQTFLGIDSSGNIIQQIDPWVNGEYNTSISLGTVLHQNLSTINGTITYPNVAYGYKQRSYDFIKAFGPLKLTGYAISTSSSLGLTVGSGTAFADGRNYQIDPNNPSYIIDNGTNVSKIFRYYQSGSSFVQNTNAGAGFTVIDPANYNPGNSGSLTPVPGGQYTVQRIFWYPNSVTKAIVAYYGNTTYNSITNARDNYIYEDFNEVENTKQNAIYLGAIIIKSNGVFTTPADYQIITAGLFRAVTGGGGGGSGATSLASLSDVTLTTPSYGDLLMYDSTYWFNTKTLSGSYTLSGSLTTNDGVSVVNLTASIVSASSITGSLLASNSLDTSLRKLFGTNNNGSNFDVSIAWGDRDLYDDSGLGTSVNKLSVDYNARILYYSDGTAQVVNWASLLLKDGNTSQSMDWGSRVLNDINQNTALSYTNTGSSNGVRLYGTSSYALTASLASTASYVNGMIIKSNATASGAFIGNPKKATVTFTTPFPNANYSITVTGEDARTWTIESKASGSFVINSNSNTALANNVYWQAISIGEFSQ